MIMYLWEVSLTEKGYMKNCYKQEVDKIFISAHPWIPRIYYDNHGVAGWESAYTNPDYVVQFYCNDTDINIIFGCAHDMWYEADRYSMETEVMREYLSDMWHNPNAAEFLKKEALKRWDWLRDKQYLEDDLVDWEKQVTTAIQGYNQKFETGELNI